MNLALELESRLAKGYDNVIVPWKIHNFGSAAYGSCG